MHNGKIIKLDLEAGTPQFDVWVKKATDEQAINCVSEDDKTIRDHSLRLGSNSHLNSGFQRLDMHI